jgi:hypothetical protein
VQSRQTVQMIERYQIFLALAFLALVAAQLIPDRVTARAPETRPHLSKVGSRSSSVLGRGSTPH